MSEYDPLSFLDGDVEHAATAVAEPAQPQVEAPAPVAAPAVEAPSAPAVAAVDDEFKGAPAGFVPYGALKEERLKRQTLEQAVKDFGAGKPANGSPPAASQPSAPVPDYGTPEYGAYVQQQLELTNLNSALNLSEARALAIYGHETVAKLQAWAADKDQYFYERILASDDPYKVAKGEYDREQAAAAYDAIPQTEFEAFKQWKADQAAAIAGNPAPAAAPTAAIAPSAFKAAQEAAKPVTKSVSSGSIVSAPTAGTAKPGEKPAGPGVAFDEAFSN